MPYSDRRKQLDYQRKWDKKNAKKKLAYKYERRRQIRERFLEFKKTLKCERCGEDHPATLDFHHVDPNNKSATIGEMVSRLDCWSWERLMKEIDKCIVLCANCHRKEHFENRDRM